MNAKQKGLCLLTMIGLVVCVLLLVAEFPYEAAALAAWSSVILVMLAREHQVTRRRLITLSTAALLSLGITYVLAHHRIVITNQSGEDVHFFALDVSLGHYFQCDQQYYGSIARMRSGKTVTCGFFDLVNPGHVRVSGERADGTRFTVAGELKHRLTILGGRTEITIQPGGDVQFTQH